MNEVLLSEVFLKIINMSISASWLVLAVLLLRLVLRKAPKWVSVLLWGFVAVRLICPFSIESMLSLIPSAETISPEIMMDWTPEISTGIGSLDTVVNPIISESFAPKPYASANPLQILIPVAAIVWLAGIAAMLLYTAVSYLLLRRKVATAVLLRNNIYQSENVDSPFVLGIIKPKIYLPFQMDGKNLEHVIAHEESHIRRKDHWWKPFGFVLLALHWFNPLMWLGYVLLCRDIELACDEKVIKEMDNENRADYTQALVACSINRRSIAACPLAFGEVGVKERVKSVMNYKKPAFWIIVAAIVICGVVAVCFLTNPKDSDHRVLPVIHSHAYVVEEVSYEGGMYSFSVVAGENSPIYAITEDMTLVSQKEVSEEGIWAQLGKLEVTELTEENFDKLFKEPENWADNVSAKNIRKNTENAWQLIYNQDVLYYVLQQKNGDLFLAYGYTGFSNNDANYAHIRWLYKLAIDTTGVSGMVAKSGDDTVPMVSFPKGTMIKDYVDSVYWLTINPSDEAFVPFSVWRDGKEIRGTYTAYDAETFEPIKHFIPSGLDPQTYLFQNANPKQNYIVLAVFSTEPDAEIYAFGAKFQKDINNLDSGPVETINGNMKTYYKNTDGTWQVEGQHYKYRLVITGRMNNAAADSTFVYLSNIENISFDQAWKAAGLSSNTADYFSVEEAVLVEWITDGNSSVSQVGGADDPADVTKDSTNIDTAITKAILEKNAGDRFINTPSGLINVESHYIFANETKSGTPVVGQTNHIEETTVYLLYAYTRYYYSGGNLEVRASTGTPAAITFSVDPEHGYIVKEFWEPNPGSTFDKDVRSKFPKEAADAVLDTRTDGYYANDLQSKCLSKAEEYLAEITGMEASTETPVAWIHDPSNQSSAYFRFQFDYPYSKIVASCDKGSLADADSNTIKKIDTNLTVGAGNSLYWTPSSSNDFHRETRITFKIYDDKEIYSGIITLRGRTFNDSDTFAYIATLDCNGLRLNVNEQAVGAMIDLVDE